MIMIKTPVEEFIDQAITQFSGTNLCESNEVCNVLLDIRQLIKKDNIPAGMTKLKLIEHATPSLLETV